MIYKLHSILFASIGIFSAIAVDFVIAEIKYSYISENLVSKWSSIDYDRAFYFNDVYLFDKSIVKISLAGVDTVTAPRSKQLPKPLTPQITQNIIKIRVMGLPVLVFDHRTDKVDPNHLPDMQISGWKENNGTVNVLLSHFENYRMRGPDLLSLKADPNIIFSSISNASDEVELHYNYHHWLGAPYTEDGKIFYTLAHTEWYACLLNKDCATTGDKNSTSTGSYVLNSWANTLTSFMSMDGGASWVLNSRDNTHLAANESFTWTGTDMLASAVYRNATNHTGLMNPSRLIREGDYYYAIVFINARDFTRLNKISSQASVVKYGYVLIRTRDISRPSGWEALGSDNKFTSISKHEFTPFLPKINGVNLNAVYPQIIYDINAKSYIVIFALWDDSGAIYYMTTSSLENPSWSDAIPIEGTSKTQVDPRNKIPSAKCNIGFRQGNYISLIDAHSAGFNFEFTDGDPWMFYVVNPAMCGGDNLFRDIYRMQLVIDYK